MKISFIIPIYKVEKYLQECIESIIVQAAEDIELILVDDGSPDSSGEICDKYAKKYDYIQVIHQENKGVSAARNVGIEVSCGQWICFIDGDDIVSPNLIKHFKEYLNEENDVCFIKHKEFNNINELVGQNKGSTPRVLSFDSQAFREFQLGSFNRDKKCDYDFHEIKLATPCKFYKKSILVEHNIRFPLGVMSGEDCIFNLYVYRFAKHGVFIDIPLYYHRVWDNSVSCRFNSSTTQIFNGFHEKLEFYIKSESNPALFRQALYNRRIWSFGFCCVLDFCHPKNTLGYKERRNKFLDVAKNYYGDALKYADIKEFRMNKRILFWFMKNRIFFMVNLLCIINNKRK